MRHLFFVLMVAGCEAGSGSDAGTSADTPGRDTPSTFDTPELDAFVACSEHGAVVAGRCVCEPGYRGAECTECQAGFEPSGAACVRLPTTWMPATHDENFDRADCRITGFPAVISYADAPTYPARIGTLRNMGGAPVGACEIVPDAFLGVAPAQRCTFTRTHEDATDPAVGGDPYGYGQSYLGPCDATIDPSVGEVTALSIGFVWQFGRGWVEALESRAERREERLWGAPYADVEVGGAGGKPLITHRERCEYWYDVTASLGASSARMTGTLEAPDGLVPGSLEIEIGDAYFHDDEGTLRDASGADVGTVTVAGAYDLTLPSSVSGEVRVYYRTAPMGDDPLEARFQRDGVWRRPRASELCRERPMMLGGPIESFTGAAPDPLPSLGLTMGDDIACYCYDYDAGECHEPFDTEERVVHFRIGSSADDDLARGIVHVGVEEPIWVEMVIDTVNDVLDLYVTTPDGRFDDTLVSHSSFCDSASSTAVRWNPSPHRYGSLVSLGEPFWALPVTSIPPDTWHQVGQWRIVGATDGAPLARQGPPLGFVRE